MNLQTRTVDDLIHFIAERHGHDIDSQAAHDLCQVAADESGYSVEFVTETVLERRHRLFVEGLV